MERDEQERIRSGSVGPRAESGGEAGEWGLIAARELPASQAVAEAISTTRKFPVPLYASSKVHLKRVFAPLDLFSAIVCFS